MSDDIVVRIRAEGVEKFTKQVKDAGGVVEDAGSKIEKTNERITGSFKKIGIAVGAAFAVGAVTNFIKESVRLADIQLKAEAQLLKALNGRESVQKRLIRQAQQLQKVTLFGDEELIAQQAFLANLGFTEKQIKKVIKAATDLSAGANISLESSVRNLAKTYSGLSGELGELVTPLRDLTQEQLKNGEAVDLVTKLYEGQAQVLAETGTGSVVQLRNAFGDLREELGKEFIPALTALAKSLTAAISKLNEFGNAISGVSEQAKFEEQIEVLDDYGLAAERLSLSLQLNSEEQRKVSAAASSLKSKEIQRLKARIDAIDKEIEARKIETTITNDNTVATAKNNEEKLKQLTVTEKYIETLKAILFFLKERTPDLDIDSALQISDSTLASLKLARNEIVKLSGDDGLKGTIELGELQTKSIEKVKDDTLRAEQEKADAREATIGGALNAAQGLFDVTSGFIDLELQRLQNALNAGQLTREQFDRERAEILRKQAIADKANAVFQIGLNTATGITAALKAGPAAPALIAVFSAIAAAQLAQVLASPIPQFAKGTKGQRTAPEGFAWVGERGPELVQMKGGEKVITAADSEQIMKVLGGYGIPVQFQSPAEELYKPMQAMTRIMDLSKEVGVDLNPLLRSNDIGRRSAGKKLDRIYYVLEAMYRDGSRKMTRA